MVPLTQQSATADTGEALGWLFSMRETVWEWMRSMREPARPGRFPWCKKGSLLKPSDDAGLGASALALKVAYQINRLADLVDSERVEWTEHIRSFQTAPPGKFSGFFEDPWMLKIADRNAGWFKKDIETRRAESRQACAALLAAGARPRIPVLQLPKSPEEVRQYVSGLDWAKNPWGAGSHAGHLVFFLKMNADLFDRTEAYNELLPVVLEELDKRQDQATGSWFLGNPSVPQKVNGAMKVLLAYDLLGRSFRWPERLIDFCLTTANEQDACHSVDIIYVLHQCARWTMHRRADILRFAEKKLDVIRRHRKPDGAFSFHPDQAGMDYYGVKVSRGLSESDIHGTHLLVWATTLIADLLGFREELGWRLPIT